MPHNTTRSKIQVGILETFCIEVLCVETPDESLDRRERTKGQCLDKGKIGYLLLKTIKPDYPKVGRSWRLKTWNFPLGKLVLTRVWYPVSASMLMLLEYQWNNTELLCAHISVSVFICVYSALHCFLLQAVYCNKPYQIPHYGVPDAAQLEKAFLCCKIFWESEREEKRSPGRWGCLCHWKTHSVRHNGIIKNCHLREVR